MYVFRRIAAVLAGLLALLPAGGATADPGPGTPITWYLLAITDESGRSLSAVLDCDTVGDPVPEAGVEGPVPHPQQAGACAQLDTAEGRIAEIPPADGFCTLEFAPVTVQAQGLWRDDFRQYQETFPNLCTAVLETGGRLFTFWQDEPAGRRL